VCSTFSAPHVLYTLYLQCAQQFQHLTRSEPHNFSTSRALHLVPEVCSTISTPYSLRTSQFQHLTCFTPYTYSVLNNFNTLLAQNLTFSAPHVLYTLYLQCAQQFQHLTRSEPHIFSTSRAHMPRMLNTSSAYHLTLSVPQAPNIRILICRVVQNRLYKLYMTVYLVISLPKIS